MREETAVHHKRGRAKNARAGCTFCKPHKANGARTSDVRREGERDRHELLEEIAGGADEFIPWDGEDECACLWSPLKGYVQICYDCGYNAQALAHVDSAVNVAMRLGGLPGAMELVHRRPWQPKALLSVPLGLAIARDR